MESMFPPFVDRIACKAHVVQVGHAVGMQGLRKSLRRRLRIEVRISFLQPNDAATIPLDSGRHVPEH